MILFVVDRDEANDNMLDIINAISGQGETITIIEQPDNVEEYSGGPFFYYNDGLVESIMGHELWRKGTTERCKYGTSYEELFEAAEGAYHFYSHTFETYKKSYKGSISVIAWNGARLGARAALAAAHHGSISGSISRIMCLEDGQFPIPGCPRTLFVTNWNPYFEAVPYVLRKPEFWEENYNPERLEKYKKLWKEHKKTKFDFLLNDNYQQYRSSNATAIWFDQRHDDASLYWRTTPQDEAKLIREVSNNSSIVPMYKGHPLDSNVTPVNWLTIPRDINIHCVLQNTDIVVTRTSGVGVEAMMYDKPVVTYGDPYYAHPMLVNYSINEELECHTYTRNMFLDFLIHEFQIRIDDTKKLIARLKGDTNY